MLKSICSGAHILLQFLLTIGANGQNCKYLTIPICGQDAGLSTATVEDVIRQDSRTRCQVGSPGKSGPAGPRGRKGEEGIQGQPGVPGKTIEPDEIEQVLNEIVEERTKRATQMTGADFCKTASAGIHSIHGDLFLCDGQGWTVFQKRVDASVNFERTWTEYRIGFGSLERNFWLGLDRIHNLVYGKTCQLRITLETFGGEHGYANYSYFSIGDEGSKYALTVGGYSGNTGNSFASSHNGMKFSTRDQDNDLHPDASHHCAPGYGGWWYNACFAVSLNAPWGQSSGNWRNIVWHSFKQLKEKMKTTSMKLRCD